jgi:ankyrin repeat protein
MLQVDQCANNGVTAFHAAVVRGHLEVARVLARAGAEVDSKRKDNGQTPLIAASNNGHVHLIPFLLERGASLQVLENDGLSALHVAARGGHIL